MSEPIPSHTVCVRCQSMLKNENPIKELGAIKYGSVGDLLESAETGCRLCAMASALMRRGATERNQGMSWAYAGNSPLRLTVFIRLCPQKDRWQGQLECITVRSTEPNHLPDRIEKWLATCSAEHRGKCTVNSRRPGGFIPSRLIKVDKDGDLSTIYVVQRQAIVHANDVGMRYTTLSHCWGSKQSLALEKSTSSRLKRGFPVEELPKTFREAVQLTQQLDVHYVWIDALCIFRDSEEDWRMEAATMSEVYANSFLNIAASTAKDNDTGLFSAQHALSPMPFRTEVDLRLVSGYEDESVFKGSYIVSDHQVFDQFLGIAPLYKRSWVFQERLLAPRTIHFGPEQMFWECAENVASEMYPIRMPRMQAPRSSCVRTTANSSINDAIKLWQDLIVEYSRGRLTVSSDKLIAISGIAREFHVSRKLKSEDYFAGLWAPSLEWQLLWMMSSHGQRPNAYRAPSWSWAAVDGELSSFPWIGTDERLFAVEEAYTVRVADPFGAVKPGCFIKVTAYLSSLMELKSWDLGSYHTIIAAPGFGVSDSPQQGCAIYWDDNSATPSEKLTAPRAVLMASHVFARIHGRQEEGLKGLVLISSENQTGEYVRVGCFETVCETRDVVGMLLSAFQASNLAEEYYEAYDATTRKYSIRIV